MAELKTKKNDKSVEEFLQSVENDRRREDAFVLLNLMRDITGDEGSMWGDSIIGFGHYHYKYESGREGDWFLTGFSPRKQSMTVYMMGGSPSEDELRKKLGKHKRSKGCLYINKLADVDLTILEEIIRHAVNYLREKYPSD